MSDSPGDKSPSSKPADCVPVSKPVDPQVPERPIPFDGPVPARGNVNRLAVLGLLALLTVAVFPIIKMFFVPVVVAATFATLFFPLYRKILKLFRNRGISAFVCCFILFAGLVTPTYLVVNLVVKQAVDLYQTAQPAIKDIVEKGGQSDLLLRAKRFPPVQWLQLSNVNFAVPLNEGVKTLATAGTKLFNKTSAGLLDFIVTLFIMFFTMFYFFMDGEALVKNLRYLFPIREDYKELIVNRFLMTSRATVMGTVAIGATQGAIGALLLLFCGIKSWLMWGFVMIILAIMPLLGAWVVLVPTGIFQIILGHAAPGIAILAVSLLLIPVIDNVMRPRLVGQGAKLHDLIVFFSSLGGIAVFGIMGFIVGPVIAALFVAVLDIYSKEFERHLGAGEKR